MDLIQQVQEILMRQYSQERASKLEQLSDAFAYTQNLKEDEMVESVNLLLAAALCEKDPEAKEAFFYTINTAIVHHQKEHLGERIDWDTLVASLPDLEKPYLDYAFNMLSLSGRTKYLTALDAYTRDPDLEIRELALDALRSLQDALKA